MPSTSLTLTIRDDGSATIDKISGKLVQMEHQAQQGAVSMSGSFDKLKENWLGLSAAATGAGLAFNKAFTLAFGAAQLEEDTARLDKQLVRVGSSAAMLTSSIKQLSGGQLSLAEATKLASQGLAVGLDPEKIKTFTQLAEIASDVLGTSVPEAFDKLLTSMATGRTTLLKQLGIFIDVEAETNKLAAATGRLASEVTAEEKARLLQNAAMEQSVRVIRELGSETASRADQMGEFKAQVRDVGDTLGGFFLDAGQKAFGGLQFLAGGLTRFASNSEAAMLATEELTGRGMRNLGFASEAGAAAMNTLAKSLQATTREMQDQHIKAFRLAETTGNNLAAALIKSAEASRVDMRVKEDHARLLAEETAQTNRLAEAMNVLDAARQQASNTALTAGTPEDAQRRLRQEGFSGTGGDTLGGAQNLLNLAKGIQGGDAGDQERLLRDLNTLVLQRAHQQVSGNQPGVSSAPFGSGSTVIQSGGAGDRGEGARRFGEDLGAFGLRQPVATQPTINITINGSLADAGALTRLIRDEIVPELRSVDAFG